MTYITGDIHGDPQRILDFCAKNELTAKDVIVILGDVALNYDLGPRDKWMKRSLSGVAPTLLCIHGNHEARPQTVAGYKEKRWNGGAVYYQPQYPNLLFAKDGEVYTLDGKRCIAIGGAYSVDKPMRLARGWAWFPDEQPSVQIKEYVERQLGEKAVDVVFSHTCPYRYEPIECFLPGVDLGGRRVIKKRWLDELERRIDYSAWYCGHWHIAKRVDRMHFLFTSFEMLMGQ